MIDRSKGFTLVRSFDASPEQVWNAWLTPTEIAQWWHAPGSSTPLDSVKVDPNVGGKYQYAMVSPDNDTQIVTGGEYQEIIPHSRLAFTWGEPGAPAEDSPLVTLNFEPDTENNGTTLKFEIQGVDGEPGDGYFYDGWVSVLDSLADYLG